MSFHRRTPTVKFSQEVYVEENWGRKSIVLAKDRSDNFLALKDGQDYEVRYLSDESTGNKGGHSFVLRLLNPDNDLDTPLILKICAYSLSNRKDLNIKKLFEREVLALKKAKAANCQRVISIIEDGELFIDGNSYYYYVMEYADNDLSNYLLEEELDFSQKILICYDLLIGLQELHKIGVYHRDIKHDNLLMCSSECKLADLGLARFQNDENIELRKKLGAYGWEAPEAINKYYVEREDLPDGYKPSNDCIVDQKSDVYQIGKVFWFIFNKRIPVGQVLVDDLIASEIDLKDKIALFDVICGMLLQSKEKRITVEEALKVFKQFANKV